MTTELPEQSQSSINQQDTDISFVSHRLFEYRGLDGKKRSIEIPSKAWKIHITWGSDLSSKGVFLWYMVDGDYKLHCLSRTRWMCNLKHFTNQLEKWLSNDR